LAARKIQNEGRWGGIIDKTTMDEAALGATGHASFKWIL
jgi:hypothetical protein